MQHFLGLGQTTWFLDSNSARRYKAWIGGQGLFAFWSGLQASVNLSVDLRSKTVFDAETATHLRWIFKRNVRISREEKKKKRQKQKWLSTPTSLPPNYSLHMNRCHELASLGVGYCSTPHKGHVTRRIESKITKQMTLPASLSSSLSRLPRRHYHRVPVCP